MTYIGKIEKGMIVLPAGVQLPEGAEVRIELVDESEINEDPFLAAIRRIAKPRPDWPDDFVTNHGFYINGEPKREP